jgi:aminopeptidase N
MRQLVAWVGDDAFMRGVQDYFKRYRWGNADLQEFLDCLRRASGRDLTIWGQDWLQTTGLNTFHAHLAEQNGRYTAFAVEQTAIPAHPTLRAHRAGIGLYDRDAKGVVRLRRRVETDITGALTPINELVGERVCDFVLLNDGDLTFAKLRFDERSLKTLKADLSNIADPLARALCWASVWDLTRDGEMAAREFVELVARHAPAETDSLLVERVTSQARSAIDLYGDPANRKTARERLHQVAVAEVSGRRLSPELQLIWARIVVATASSDESLARVAAMLDGHEEIPGIHLDTDLRWLIVGQLAEEGKADVALIQATMASDPSDIGRRRGTACLAARPKAAAKEEAWKRVADASAPMPAAWKGATAGELSVASMAAILRGFYIGSVGVGGMMAHGPDPELLRPFVQRYLDALPAVWAERTIDEAEAFTECLYPNHLVDDQVVAAIDLALEGGELPGPAVRILREGRDGTLRAQRAREVDRTAGV